ncbi:unnamed protein product [Lathyrus oleraceus]|uniref:Uncharacterized protein n=2 Tax=Pisum sativum TaxID=3888 RepID=A0A9D5GZA2_PEA|nr:uncharacterized protein LOC127073999 [Pisum sativum]KAI5446568.1 hypothetical protein KIW84_014415 [Pisum sativum]
MGTSHSTHTNLGKDSTSFKTSATGSIARWGDSFEVSMSKWNENDHTEAWGVKYKTGLKNRTCGFNLKATNDNNGIESIHFGLLDNANNKTEFAVNISRVDRDTLRGGITGLDSSVSPKSFTRTKPDCVIETTLVSYHCSHREGLFVLEMKKKGKSENVCIVNLAHYYVTKDVGLSVTARIYRNKGNNFVVEVEGPIKHPSVDLRKAVVKTCSTGVWSPGACSHCKGTKTKASTGVKNEDSISSLKGHTHTHVQHSSSLVLKGESHVQHSSSLLKGESHVQRSDRKVGGEIVKHAFFSSSVREQFNTGLINSTGYTSGSLNNSIIFVDCNF